MIETGSQQGSGRAAFARNASTSYLFRILYGVVVVLLTPYLFRRLGQAGFGTYSVFFTFTTVFNLVELSFSNGIAKVVSELRGRGKTEETRRTLGTAVLLGVCLGAAALAMSLLIAAFAAGLAATGQTRDFQISMVLLGGVMLVRMPCVAYSGALTGFQRYDLLSTARTLAALGLALGTVAAVELGGGLLGASLALAAYLLLEALLYAVMLRRMDPTLKLRPERGTQERRRSIASFASYLLLADGLLFIGQRMQTVIIAGIRGAAAAAPFAAAVKFQTGLQSLVIPFVDLLLPMVSELDARGQRERVVSRLALSTRAALQITLPVAVGFSLFAHDAVDVWLGANAPPVTVPIMIILMAVQVVTLTATPAAKVLAGLGKVRWTAALSSVEGLSSLVLTVVLVSAHGALGAAIPMLLTSLLIAPIMLPLVCRTLAISASAFARANLLPAIWSSLPGVAAMLALRAAMSAGAPRLLIGLTVGLTISLIIAVRQIGTDHLRGSLAALRVRGRIAPADVPTAS